MQITIIVFNVLNINCMTINDLAGKLQGQLLIDSAEFVNNVTSKETCSKYGFTLEQLPALFIPNTYNQKTLL